MATTVPTEGFSLFACVNSKPPAVCSSASATLMRIRSFSGFISLTSSPSRIPMMSSSFKMR
uniref:GSVIVT01015036001, CPN21 n=1 Tax=Arundo donax TaxID=35708 RepID=A0A0A9EMA8_ARUDO